MLDITRKPYEISLWEDDLVYLVSFLNAKGEEIGSDKYYGSLADLVSPEGTKDTKITQYYEERKLCIIGSNTMDTPVRAT
jgi:hypothetical protein